MENRIRYILLCGTSGSGKSGAMRRFRGTSVVTVELDDVIMNIYKELVLGAVNENGTHWVPFKSGKFLKENSGNAEVIALLREQILKYTSSTYKTLVVVGSQFFFAETEKIVLKALMNHTAFMPVKKLFLDVSPEVVLSNIKKRNRTCKDTQADVKRKILVFREKMSEMGYIAVSDRELIAIVGEGCTIIDKARILRSIILDKIRLRYRTFKRTIRSA
jgi:dephospho-CoA kinase